MEYVKLSDVCDVRDGTHDSPKYVANGYPLVTSKNIIDGKLDLSVVNYLSKDDYDKINERSKVDSGDIIMPMIGTIGNPFLVDDFSDFAIKNVALIKFPKKDVINRFVLYFFKSSAFERYITKNNKGGTQKFLSLGDIRNVPIPKFCFEKQTEIVNNLDKLFTIIGKRKEELFILDTLIKARFVEMFGNPEMNPYGWQKINISNIVQGKVSNGYFAKRDEYVEDGNAAILGVAYIVNRMYSGIEGLPRTNVTLADIQKYKVRYGDMLFCRSSLVAEGIGKASIVPENVPDNTLFECHVIRLPLDMDKCVPEFMQVLSTTDYFRKQMIAQSKTATMTTIGQDGIKKANIILPPIEKQREFYSFVKQIDKSKVAIQKSLAETQLLFDKLMQDYFG